jgi:type IV secretion system protein VirD4
MSESRRGVSDGALVAAIGSVLVVGLLIWLWGGIAGVAFGSGWPRVGVGELAGILVRLPARLADPARAWPQPARARLPAPTGFYAALAILLAAVASAVWVIGLSGARGLWDRRSGARWARSRDLRALRKRAWPARGGWMRARGQRLTLGRRAGRLLHAEHRHAVVAFGPPQSGKSAGLAVPALLEWQGPAVASSIKTDLLDATANRRRALGDVFVFDPFELTGGPGQGWSPLHAAQTWDGALEVAWRLAGAAELDQRGVEGGDFWAIAAEQRLAPLLYIAAVTGAGMDSVVRWLYGQGARELDQALNRLSEFAGAGEELDAARVAFDAVRAFEALADRTRSSIEATAQALLRAYRFARVLRSARCTEILPDRLLDQSATVYLIGDAKASKLLRPIFLALLSEIVDRAYERAAQDGGRLERSLLLCLDEAGHVAPLPNLAEVASTAPSHNIQLVSIFHDLAQARSRYGSQAETVVNSHAARMLLPGVADLETLRYFAGLVGEEEGLGHTRTTWAGGPSRSTARRRRPLVAPEALRQLPEGHALLLYGRLAPTRLKLRMWFADRRLRAAARSSIRSGR